MENIRVRRDIRLLTPTQRKRFFTCLKMLAILPPVQQNNFRRFQVAWKYQNNQRSFKTVIPLNIHDEMIASHQTCCQHGVIYFTYYHRHLLNCLEIYLNYAEQVLLQGATALPKQMYTKYSKQFDDVFKDYNQNIAALKKQLNLNQNQSLEQLSIHFWNPLDYTKNIEIPQQLKARTPDAVDRLTFAVNGHYPWSFNFATRWFSRPGQTPTLPAGFLTMGYFQSIPVTYNRFEQEVIAGKLNPRSQNAVTFFDTFSDSDVIPGQMYDSLASMNLYKNYQNIIRTGNTIDVCTMTNDQVSSIFGSATKSQQWISQQERLNYKSADLSARSFSYNKSLPHYQWAYSLFKSNNSFLKNYVSTTAQSPQNSMENSHNTMHNNLQLFMSDAQISITNLVFFLYHSWIDYELQIKIRMIRQSGNNQSEYISSRNYLDAQVKTYSILNDVLNPTKKQLTYGEYYIFEWAIPVNRFWPTMNTNFKVGDYQIAFKSRNFIINEKAQGIRQSNELNQFYQQQYVAANRNRYSYYKNFEKHSFNYTYQLIDYSQQGQIYRNLLTDQNVSIPSYIQAIANDYIDVWNGNITKTISQTKTLNAEKGKLSTKGNKVNKKLLKVLKNTIFGYGNYPSTIKSTKAPILLKFTQKGEKQLLNLSEEWSGLLRKGIPISSLSILTRGSGAKVCPNCGQSKEFWIQISQTLAQMNSQLYCALQLNFTHEILYESKNGVVKTSDKLKIKDAITLSSISNVFTTLKFVDGIRQATFKVQYKGEAYEDEQIQINLYCYCAQDEKLFSICSRTSDELNCNLQFCRMIGVESADKHFKQYIYRQVKGWVRCGVNYTQFNFPIETSAALFNFKLLIEQITDEHGSHLDLTFLDKDYNFKMNHYSVAEQ